MLCGVFADARTIVQTRRSGRVDLDRVVIGESVSYNAERREPRAVPKRNRTLGELHGRSETGTATPEFKALAEKCGIMAAVSNLPAGLASRRALGFRSVGIVLHQHRYPPDSYTDRATAIVRSHTQVVQQYLGTTPEVGVHESSALAWGSIY